VRKNTNLNQESFNKLLSWLDPEREEAGEKYEEIRKRLIKIFVHRGCDIAEDLADETINRVAGKVKDIADTYVGNPALYFYGVAQKVFLEWLKKKPDPSPLLALYPTKEIDENYECLAKCLSKLPLDSQRLIIEYFQEDNQGNIKHRKELAKQIGISQHTLRMRAYRIRENLRSCILACREQRGWANTFDSKNRGF